MTAARVLYRLSGLTNRVAATFWQAGEAVEKNPEQAAALAAWAAVMIYRVADALAPRRRPPA